MNTLLMCVIVFVLYIIAYHTYGKFLAKKIFNIDPESSPKLVETSSGPFRFMLPFGSFHYQCPVSILS